MLKTQQNSRAKKKKIKFASKCCHGLQLLKEMKRRDEYRCALKDVALKSNKKKKCVKKKKRLMLPLRMENDTSSP